MEEQNPLHLTLPGYISESSFCCQSPQKWGVCIFVCKYLYYSKINISGNCQEKDIEIPVIELETKSYKLIVSSWYRVPQKILINILKNLDVVKHLYRATRKKKHLASL